LKNKRPNEIDKKERSEEKGVREEIKES